MSVHVPYIEEDLAGLLGPHYSLAVVRWLEWRAVFVEGQRDRPFAAHRAAELRKVAADLREVLDAAPMPFEPDDAPSTAPKPR